MIGLLFGVLYLAHSFWWMPLVHGSHRWEVAGDTWLMTGPARYVAHGALGYLYSGREGYFSLPLPAILLAPAVWLADRFNLVDGYPFALAHPTTWIIVGPWMVVSVFPALHAVRRLAGSFSLSSAQLTVLQFWFGVAVLMPSLCWSHPEDVLALGFLLYSLTAAREERTTAAALHLAVAICCKQWAIVAIPFLYLRTRPGHGGRFLLGSILPPALLAAFPLAVDWPDASQALLFPTFPAHVRFGHHSLLLQALVGLAGPHASVLARFTEIAAAPVVALLLRRYSESTQLAGLGAVLLLRLVLEPVVFPYYICPAITVLCLAGVAKTGRLPVRLMTWSVILVLWSLPGTNRNGLWWAGTGLVLGAMTWAARPEVLGKQVGHGLHGERVPESTQPRDGARGDRRDDRDPAPRLAPLRVG